MPDPVPAEARSHKRLFAVLSLLLAASTAWAVVDEVHTRRPWKAHQAAYAELKGETTPPRVRQHVVPALDAIDRCATCHAGIEDDSLVDADLPAVLAPHPDLDGLLGDHPTERFGCVSCHRGLGPALTAEQAHGHEGGHWPDPMLPGVYVQSGCLACHLDDEELTGAPLLSRGRALFVELGCDDCHLAIDDSGGSQSPHQRGPSLRHVGSKLRPGALVQQIRLPEQRRADFRMPRFWPGADDDPAMAERQDTESLAIAAFLVAASEPWGDGISPAAGDAAAGERLFDRLGCRGCHVLGVDGADDVLIDDDEPEQPGGGDAWGDFGGGGDAWGDFGGGEEPAEEPSEEVAPAFGHGPALGDIAARLKPSFFTPWLLDPASYSADTTMPSMRLDEAQAADLTAWLSTLGASDALPSPPGLDEAPDPALVEQGRGLVADYGCFGCHDIPGFEDEGRPGPDLAEYGRKARMQMHFGEVEVPEEGSDWDFYTRTKLQTPRAYEGEDILQVMPGYEFEEGEVEALAVFLRGLRGDAPPTDYVAAPAEPEPVRDGRALATELNCSGCHTLDGVEGGIRKHYARDHLMPPLLDGEGKRVRPDWLYGFLLEPTPLRPWLEVRMPTFGLESEEAEALVAWITWRDGERAAWRPSSSRPLSAERATAAAVMIADLKCVQCHQLAAGGEVDSADLAPDLGLARQRLDRRWVRAFLEDPGAALPGTRMPQFFPDGQSPFPDLLGGDADAQMDLLVDHLMNLGLQSGAPAPVAEAPAEQDEGETP